MARFALAFASASQVRPVGPAVVDDLQRSNNAAQIESFDRDVQLGFVSVVSSMNSPVVDPRSDFVALRNVRRRDRCERQIVWPQIPKIS